MDGEDRVKLVQEKADFCNSTEESLEAQLRSTGRIGKEKRVGNAEDSYSRWTEIQL